MKLGMMTIAVLVAWVIPTAVLSTWLTLTPDVLLRQAPAGAVESVTVHHSWNSAEDTTTLKTSLGTFAVKGLHSAPHGEALVIADTTKDGELVCAEGDTGTCAPFSGSYLGALRPVPHPPVLLGYVVRQNLWAFTAVWGVAGGLASALFAMFWLVERCGECDGGDVDTHANSRPWNDV